MAERFARPLEKCLFSMGHAQRVSAHDTDTVGVHVAQSLTESLQAGERTGSHLLVDPAVLFDTGREAHHLAQTVDDDELAVRIARDDHVEAVRSEIDSRKNVGDGLCRCAGLRLQGQSGRASRTHTDSRCIRRPRTTSRNRRSWLRSDCESRIALHRVPRDSRFQHP